MEEQLLKDFLETAKNDNYDWDVVMAKFPELKDVDLQLLKDYAATAETHGYDYSVVNAKFPELFGEKEVAKTTEGVEPPVKKKDSTDSSSEDGSLDSRNLYDKWEQKYNISQAGVSPIPSLDELQVDDDMRDTRVPEEETAAATSEEIPKQKELTAIQDVDRSKPIVLPEETVAIGEIPTVPTDGDVAQKERTLSDSLSTEGQDATRVNKTISIPSGVKDQESYLPRGSKEIFNQELKNVTAELVGKEEQFVVPQMNHAFGDYGFSFEEAGALGDKMVVKSKSGNAITIDLDPILGSTESSEAKKLTKFLSDNRVESQFLAQKEGTYVAEQKKITTAKELNDKFMGINTSSREFERDADLYVKESRELLHMGDVLASVPESERSTPEYNQKIQEYKELLPSIEKNRVSLVEREEQLRREGQQIDKLAGEYYKMASKQGEKSGFLWNNFVDGAGTFSAAFSSHGINIESYLRGAEFYLGEQGYQDSYEQRAFEVLGAKRPDGTSFTEWKNNLANEYNSHKIKEVESAVLDDSRKTEKFGEISRYRNPFSQVAAVAFDEKKGEVDRARALARELIGSESTTESYASKLSEDSRFWRSFGGAMQSLPAMMVPGFSRVVAFGLQQEDAINREMSGNPEFDKISETEKLKLTIPIAITAGILEEFGFRNLMSQKGLLSDVMMNAISKLGVKVTGKTFKEFVRNDVKNRLAKGALIITSAGLAEYETGAMQQAAEFGFKDIYNAVKEKEMFDTPDTLVEWVSEVHSAGLDEMIGGMIMGSVPATMNAFSSGTANKLDDETFRLFDEIRKDPNYRKFYNTELKRKVALQEITAEERVEKLALYDTVSAVAHNVPAKLTPKKRKVAIELLMEKAKLEREVKGKDPILAKKEIEQIEAIDKKLEAISEPASISKEDTEAFNALPKEVQQEFMDATDGDINSAMELFTDEQAKLKEMFGDTQQDVAPVSREKLTEIADKATKAMSKVSKGTRIVIHETNEEYLANTTQGEGRGEFAPNEDGGVIHINASRATASTIPHEVFHAVFINKMKTDEAAVKMAEQMMVSVRKALPENSELGKTIDDFAARYTGKDAQFQNEERLAELTGILASMKDGYKQLDKPAKTAIKQFFEKIAEIFGIDLSPDFGKTDESVIDLINTLAKKTATGEVITVEDIEVLDNGTNPIGKPTEIRMPKKKKRKQKLTFKDSYENSLVTPDKQVDIDALIKKIVDENGKVWFWVADQLGIGEGIDGGPSFAHQTPGDIWASSMPVKGILNNISQTEYLFIISGSPTLSKLFNKKVYDLMTNKLGVFDGFKKDALALNPVKDVRAALEKYNSWEEMRESTERKPFLVALEKSQATPNSELTKYIQSIDGYVDLESLRDGFYKENDFKQNDIMLVLKPTNAREGSDHSTYDNTVEGEVIGVPDVKVNALEVMPQEMADKYEGRRSQAAQAIAPYGSGRKNITPRKQKLAQANKNGEAITTDREHTLYKGMLSKMKNGRPFSVHTIKEGTFAALDKKLANDYKGNQPLKEFTIPKGTEVQVVKLDTKEGVDAFRRKEEQAIDASDAQVVKLITYDTRGKSEQYIIKDNTIAPRQQKRGISPENSSNYANLTEDGEGNFVFYHVGKKGYKQVRPSTGNRQTSKAEAAALSKVGGLAMYYVDKSTGESMVTGEAKYEVKVPMDKVYDFNTDPLNLMEEAKEMHNKQHPGKSFGFNEQLAYITKIASKKGFDMVVSEWKDGTRAQAATPLKPTDVSIKKGDSVVKEFGKTYDSNKDKGFTSVIPETKSEKLTKVYDKISESRNKEKKYGALYHLRTEFRKQTQEEISKLINESNISDELKAEYNEVLAAKDEGRKSVKNAKAGQRLFNNPNPETSKITEKYKQENGIETEAGKPIRKLDKKKSKEISDEFDKMEHSPNDPKVVAAYNALAEETVKQYDALVKAGYDVEVFEGKGEPYNNSAEMIEDVVNNKHIFILASDVAFGDGKMMDNPLLKDSGKKDINGKPLVVNDLFRAVHDFFGHTERGNGFGALGEENAWDVHARMFTPLARRAMTTETKGQNSWVNFSGVNDGATSKILEARKLDNQGKTEEANALREEGLGEFKFADQKIGLMPEWVSEIAPRQQKSVESKPVKVDVDGNHLNVGMKIGKTNKDISAQEIKEAIPNDVEVLNEEIIEEGSSEQTLALETSRALDNAEMGDLMVDTQQEAIPQVSDKKGVLHAQTQEALDDWGGVFNPEYFTFSKRQQKTPTKEEAIAKQPMSKRRRAIIERAKAKEAMNEIAKGRQQKDMVGTIAKAREEGISDAAIKDYLTRVLKYPAKEVAKAMEVKVDLLTELPESFKNIEGGANAGVKLFNRVKAYEQRLVASNNKRKVKMSKQEIVDKTIEFLEAQPEYKAQAETYTVGSEKKGTKVTKTRKHFSAQQAAMIVEFQKEVGTRPSKGLSKKLKELRDSITNRKRGARSLQEAKSKVKMLLRKGLPTSLYTKSEVIDIIRKIDAATEANTKDLDGERGSSIENILTEVSQLIVSKNISILDKKIGNILTGKFTKRELGRLKGKKISIKAKERIDAIKAVVLGKDTTAEDINALNAKLIAKFNELGSKEETTEADVLEMSDLKTMINLNSLALMEDTNVFKIAMLDGVLTDLTSIVEEGRTEFQVELEEAKAKYDENASIAYSEVTGNNINFADPDSKSELANQKFKRNNAKEKQKVQNNIRKFTRGIINAVTNYVVSHEALDGLMDLISRTPGEMFGGKLQEMVSNKIDESTRNFKKRMMMQEKVLKNKLQELYGRNWAKKSRQNSATEATGIIANGEELFLSQNQMYYLYNQYKDPANHKAFESDEMYGVEAPRVMLEMAAKLDAKVKEFADWQVDEYFPSLYEHYNSVYRKIYRTNMPWNEFYAGRIYRKGIEMETLDLLGENSIQNTVAGAASTKERINSSAEIEAMNGTNALATYIKDMEHFAAYAENIKDIDKTFKNKYVSDAISSIHGEAVLGLIRNQLQVASKRGVSTSFGDKLVNTGNTLFVLGRLAAAPVIMLKQYTSFITYANDIGPLNWMKYGAKNMAEFKSVLKEVKANSVYMQDRKNQSVIRTIESYSNDKMTDFVPNPTKEFYVNMMMWHIKQGDAGAIYLGGLPNYSFYKAEFQKKNPNATEQQAIDHAIIKFERDTKRTQQSADSQDKDVHQTGNPFARFLNMFMTTPKQYLRKEIQGVRNLYRKIAAWDKNAGKGTVTENLRTFAMYHVITPMLFQYITLGLPGLLRPTRDDDKDDMLRAAIVGNLNAFIIMGEAVAGIADYATGKPWAMQSTKSAGILQVFARLAKLAKRWESTKDVKKKEIARNNLVAEFMTLSSVPAPTMLRMKRNYEKLLEGDGDAGENILRILNYSEYQISGSSSKKKKKRSGKPR